MTRADVILMIEFNALIRYRDSNGHEHHGIVIGDSYSRFNGENTYTVKVKDPEPTPFRVATWMRSLR